MDWKKYQKNYDANPVKEEETNRSRVLLTLPTQAKEFRLKDFGEGAKKDTNLEFVLRGIPTLVTPALADIVPDKGFRGAVGGQFLGFPYKFHIDPERQEGGIRDRVLCAAGHEEGCPRCMEYPNYRDDKVAYKYFKAREGRLFYAQINGDPQVYSIDWPLGEDGFWGALNAALGATVKARRVPANWYTIESDVALNVTTRWDDSKGAKRAYWKVTDVFPVRAGDTKIDPAAMDWDTIFGITDKTVYDIDSARAVLERTLPDIVKRAEAISRSEAGKPSTGAGGGKPTGIAAMDLDTMDYESLCRYCAAKKLDIDMFAFDDDTVDKFRAEVKRAEEGGK